MRAQIIRAFALGSAWLLASCTFDEKWPNPCRVNADCGANQMCHRGFCVVSNGSTGDAGSGQAGRSSGGAGGSIASGGTGAAGRAGQGAVAGAGAGQAGGTSGQAGSGGICSSGASQSCEVPVSDADRLDGCGAGTRQCADGEWSECLPDQPKAAETCNGRDDDCDGMTDEAAEANRECYPDNLAGCPQGKACVGACARGMQVCSNGVLSECQGFVGPKAKDACDSQIATDDDCNGKAGENCGCSAGQTRSCFTADPKYLSNGNAVCKAGVQTCSGGVYNPACNGEVTPTPETCANPGRDDDCNGVVDDVSGLNVSCLAATTGGGTCPGTQQCQSGQLSCVQQPLPSELCNGRDDDCDGKVDETFLFDTDRMHCGNCVTVCSATQTCMAGSCVTVTPSDDGGV